MTFILCSKLSMRAFGWWTTTSDYFDLIKKKQGPYQLFSEPVISKQARHVTLFVPVYTLPKQTHCVL